MYDKNFDDKAIEVLDNKGNVILQVQLLGKNVVLLGMVSAAEGQNALLGGSDGWLFEQGPNGEVITTNFFNDYIGIKKITPLFHYPSSSYPGKRIHLD